MRSVIASAYAPPPRRKAHDPTARCVQACMLHHRKAETPRRRPAATALDAGATIQDALVRRLRFARPVTADAGERLVQEDRVPIARVVGRRA
jgi:hypothetical protein